MTDVALVNAVHNESDLPILDTSMFHTGTYSTYLRYFPSMTANIAMGTGRLIRILFAGRAPGSGSGSLAP